ncbi:MAG TPA: hypothetical protein VFL97_00490, partial [Nitrococcus sp.]|nr:hypothetical protein [Nitrococcus sp.]
MPEYMLLFIIGAVGLIAAAAMAMAARALSRLSRLSARLPELERAQAQLDERFQGLAAGAIGQGRRF